MSDPTPLLLLRDIEGGPEEEAESGRGGRNAPVQGAGVATHEMPESPYSGLHQ